MSAAWSKVLLLLNILSNRRNDYPFYIDHDVSFINAIALISTIDTLKLLYKCKHVNIEQINFEIWHTSGGIVDDASPGYGRIWLDHMSCSGNERSLLDCGHYDWGSNKCQHSNDVAIKCGKCCSSCHYIWGTKEYFPITMIESFIMIENAVPNLIV